MTLTTAIVARRSAASRAAATSASSDSYERTTGTTIVRYSSCSAGPRTSAGARIVSERPRRTTQRL